jgi:hypothetical protein
LAETKPMMIVDKDTVSATMQKIADPKKLKQAIADIKKMLEIKEALLWRSEGMTPCCGSLSNVSAHLTREVGILEHALSSLESGDKAHASELLQEYIDLMKSCEVSEPDYC